MSLEHLGKNRLEQLLQWGHNVGQIPNIFMLGYLSQALVTNWSHMFLNTQNQFTDEPILVKLDKHSKAKITQARVEIFFFCPQYFIDLWIQKLSTFTGIISLLLHPNVKIFKQLLLKQIIRNMSYWMFCMSGVELKRVRYRWVDRRFQLASSQMSKFASLSKRCPFLFWETVIFTVLHFLPKLRIWKLK